METTNPGSRPATGVTDPGYTRTNRSELWFSGFNPRRDRVHEDPTDQVQPPLRGVLV
jgi:hypothetical protein